MRGVGTPNVRERMDLQQEAVRPTAPPLRRRPTNAVPQLAEWKERAIRVLAVVTLAYWTYYIVWRWGWTLNPKHLWFSIPLALAETWGLLTAFIMVLSVWRLRHRQPIEPPPGLTVDVFITCYDEPLEVIRRTAIGARAIRYPHETWILDDGERDEVQEMAAELGLGYLRRTTHEHAKAGNLNHALKHTKGDFILQLDADHVPLPHILDRLLGFFVEDPKLAFVQTPQDFYNTDAFTYNVNETSRRIWEEQRLFFGVIQPGKDSINCTFFCGCSAVIRREALDQIGGFSMQTITEDIETSLVLHANGWNSAFYGESLVYGLAAHSAVAFHTQHLRWGQGGMQVLKRFNPLTYPGLTLQQRLSYFGSLTAYVGGPQKLIYYASPLIFFTTGVLPINALNAEFLARFLPFLALSFALSEALSRGRASTLAAERFHMVKFWTYTRAVASIFSRKEQKFKVTPKGPGHVPFKTYAPQVAVMALSAGAIVWATLAYRFGWVRYRVPGWESLAFQTNAVWAALNFIVAWSVVKLSLRVRTQRTDHRFRDRFPVSVSELGVGGRKARPYVALAEDLNPQGMAFRSTRPMAPGARVRLKLPLSTASVEVWGQVLHSVPLVPKKKKGRGRAGEAQPAAKLFRTGVQFQDVPLPVRDRIELHCTQHAVPLEQSQYSISFPHLFEKPLAWVRNARRERRERVDLPARVEIGRRRPGEKRSREAVGFLEEVSAGGARLVMDDPLVPGTPVRFSVPGTGIEGRGRVVFARSIETPLGVRFAVGVKRQGDASAYDGKTDKGGRGRMTGKIVTQAAGLLVLAFALGGTAAPAAAQGLQPVIYGATEFDTEDLQLYLLGASVTTGGEGLGFGAGAMVYHLRYDGGAQDASQTAVAPTGIIRYGMPTGAVQLSAGYIFISGDEGLPGAPGGGEDGVITTLQGNYWGDDRTNAQAIASYNWGGEYLWTNARATRRVTEIGGRGVNLGGELTFQGGLGGDDDLLPGTEEYQAWQAGVVAEYQVSPALRLTGVVGGKTTNIDEQADLFPYFKLEFVAIPGL